MLYGALLFCGGVVKLCFFVLLSEFLAVASFQAEHVSFFGLLLESEVFRAQGSAAGARGVRPCPKRHRTVPLQSLDLRSGV